MNTSQRSFIFLAAATISILERCIAPRSPWLLSSRQDHLDGSHSNARWPFLSRNRKGKTIHEWLVTEMHGMSEAECLANTLICSSVVLESCQNSNFCP